MSNGKRQRGSFGFVAITGGVKTVAASRGVCKSGCSLCGVIAGDSPMLDCCLQDSACLPSTGPGPPCCQLLWLAHLLASVGRGQLSASGGCVCGQFFCEY